MSVDRLKWHPSAQVFCKDRCIAANRQVPDDWPRALKQTVAGLAINSDQPNPDPLIFTQTGGSSASPKVIGRTQASWIASFLTNARCFGLGPGQRLAILGDISHSLALYALLEGVHLGMTVHLCASLRPDAQVSRMRAAKTNILYATPSQLRQLIRHSQLPDLPDVTHVFCGGGMLSNDLRTLLSVFFPNANLRVFYGAAETSFITLETPHTPLGSVGHAYPGVELQIRDDAGQPTTGPGHVWARSPYLAISVNDQPIAKPDGYVTVGEIGQMDASGALYLLGRHDRAVNVADQIVHPETAEALIAPFGDCAVLPRTDAYRGQVLVAIMAGAKDKILAQTILAACRSNLPSAACPRHVLFHPGFPRLSSCKPDLVALTHWLAQRP